MSILIKGMEMPENCFECPWRCKVDPENLLCRISGEYFEETFSGTIQNRHNSCPLVPVPPHGRLIDADALSDMLEKYKTEYALKAEEDITHLHKAWGLYEAELMSESLPTIIEAEEGE